MASNKLRILIMRDNEKVRSFYVSATWFTFLVWLFILLAGFSALGGTVSWWLYQKYVQYQETDQEKDRHIVELRYQLERCQNMERLVGGGVAPLPAPTPPVSASPPSATPAPAAQPEQGGEAVARVSNLTARSRPDNQIRLSFDLSNNADGTVLTGNVLVAIQTKDNRFIDVSPPRDELAFQIARFKRVATVFSLPDTILPNDVTAVRIQIQFVNGTSMPPEVFPFPYPPGS